MFCLVDDVLLPDLGLSKMFEASGETVLSLAFSIDECSREIDDLFKVKLTCDCDYEYP